MSTASPLEDLVYLRLNLPFAERYQLSTLASQRAGVAYGQAIEHLVGAAANLVDANGAILCVPGQPDLLIRYDWRPPPSGDNLDVISCYVDVLTHQSLVNFQAVYGFTSPEETLSWMLHFAGELLRALKLHDTALLIYSDGTQEKVTSYR